MQASETENWSEIMEREELEKREAELPLRPKEQSKGEENNTLKASSPTEGALDESVDIGDSVRGMTDLSEEHPAARVDAGSLVHKAVDGIGAQSADSSLSEFPSLPDDDDDDDLMENWEENDVEVTESVEPSDEATLATLEAANAAATTPSNASPTITPMGYWEWKTAGKARCLKCGGKHPPINNCPPAKGSVGEDGLTKNKRKKNKKRARQEASRREGAMDVDWETRGELEPGEVREPARRPEQSTANPPADKYKCPRRSCNRWHWNDEVCPMPFCNLCEKYHYPHQAHGSIPGMANPYGAPRPPWAKKRRLG